MQDISPQGGECPSFSLSRGQAVPPIQRCAAGGEKRPILGREEWPPSAAGNAGVHRRECRRLAAETKGGKGTIWFPCPLLTPPNPPLRRDALRLRGETGVRGLGSGRRADFGMLLCPEFTLRDLQRCQCAARRYRAAAFRCEKLRFHQGCTLGAPNAPVGPSLFDARPKGVAS